MPFCSSQRIARVRGSQVIYRESRKVKDDSRMYFPGEKKIMFPEWLAAHAAIVDSWSWRSCW